MIDAAPLAVESWLLPRVENAPAPLTEPERRQLAAASLADAPPHVQGDVPEWLAPSFAAVFGEQAAAEGEALARRAPVDLRVNGLKGERGKAERALAHLHPEPTPHSPWGLRLSHADKTPAMAAEPAYVKGLVEVQDEG